MVLLELEIAECVLFTRDVDSVDVFRLLIFFLLALLDLDSQST